MTIMKPKTDKPLHLLPLMTGIAVLLFGAAGVASTMGWQPNSTDAFGDIVAIQAFTAASARPVFAQIGLIPSQVAGDAPNERRCAECGVIASIRKVEASGEDPALSMPGIAAEGKGKGIGAKPARSYEFIVRLEDGSHRVITDANPTAWRLRERVNVIDGMDPSNK